MVTLGTPTPSASKTNQTAISLPFSASKSATFACALDAAAAAPCSSPVQYSTLADGAHTITVTATDAAGNVSAPASYGWSISTVPPDTLILAAPPLLTRQTTASFAISSLPVGDALLCSLDGAAFATCGTTPSYASLADGVHRFAAKAVDAYGNVDPTPAQSSWTVDTRPPAAPVISAPQNGATLATDVPAISGVAEAGSTVAVYVDGVQVCSAVADVNGNYACTLTARQALRDGAHVITATATDRAGNVSPQASPVDVNTATSAPVTAIVSGPTNPSNQTSAAFVLSANRSPVTYACSLDGAAYAACTSTPQFSGLAAGAHTLRAQATDAQGHADPTPPAWSWTIVTATPPAPAIAAPTSGATLSTATPTFSGTSAPGSTVALTVDGIVVGTVTADSTGAFSFTLPASEELPDGPHAVTAQATDAAGNQSAPSAATSFSTSTAAPDTTIVAGPPAATNSSSASFKFASTHPAATFQCSLDGAAFSACPATFQLSGVAPGGHLLAVRAVDSIADPTPAFWPWTIDTSLPAAPLFSAPANGSTLGSATPTLAGTTVPGAAVVITVDGAVVGTVTADANGDFSFTLTTPLADGSHQVTAQAKDPAGNTSPASAVLGFSTLATPPSTTLTQKPTALTNVAAAQFAFTGNRSDDVFECSLDGGAFASCTSPKSYTLPDGPHTFVVRARDILGNVDQNPPSYTWTIDTTPPVVTLGTPSPASSPTHVTSMSLPFSANETSTFTCALDSVAPAVCSSPAGYASLADGAHTIAVVATDAAGNASAPARYAWTVDTVLPVVSLTATPAAALTNQTSIGFTFTADKAGSAFQCSIDSATAAACSSPKGYSGLADGNHSFTVTATDPAGNLSAPATHAWTVNTTPPPAPIIVAPAEGQVLYTATPAISGTAAVQTQLALAVDGTQVASLAVQPGGSWSYTLGAGQALADGTHVATAVATDAAGNLSPQALRDFSTHSALPHTTIVSAPARSTNQRTAAFVFASDIAGSTFECALDGASFAPCANPYNLSGLVEAQHSLSVRAKDPAGRFDPTPPSWLWTVDLTPPAAPIITYPADQQTIATRTPVLTGTAEPNALVRVFVDDMEVGMASGAAQVPSIVLVDGSGHWSIAMPPVQALSTGAHVAIAQTTDQAGNTGPTSAPNQFFVAGAPPATAITAGPAAFTNATAASFTIVATPAGDALDCALDGAAFAPCSSPAAYAGLAAGAHLFSARARDAAGAVDPAPPTWAWVIDLTPPAAPVIAVPVANATVPTATPVISGTAEANASVSVSVDGAAIGTTLADGSGNWSIAVPPPDALANGAHLATARATDQAGNAGPPSAPTPFSVLSTAPDTFVLSGPSAWTRLSSATLAFGSDRSPATYQCRVDGAGGFSSCPQMLTLSGMTDGAHLVEVSAIDAAGNVDPSPATWSWTVDQTPPAPPQIVLPMRSSLLHTATPAVAGSAQPFASVDVWVDGAPEGSASADAHGQWILVLTRPQALLDGPHAAVAQATDAAGNQSAASASDPFTTLTGAPTTSVLTGPAALTNATAASFTFGSNRSPVTYQCALDGAAGAACNQAQAWSGFAEGRHLISVQAADAAGNVDPAPATWQWTVDTTPPHTTIVRAPPATTNSNSAGFAFAASKEGSTFECALDGASFASCQSSLIFQVSDGAHTLLARAVDLAGNRDPAPASATWTVQHVVTFAGGGCSSADATTAAAALGLLVLLWRRRRQAARLP